MEEIIQIKCPFDGAVLSVRNQPGIENKNVTCPICKHKYPFNQFRRVAPALNTGNADPDTEYPDGYLRGGSPDEATDILDRRNFTLGRIMIVDTGATYRLKPGRNVIGRKASRSAADFQIDTAEKRMMSREHIVIEVKKVPAKGFVHYISLYKDKVNKTYIGSEPLLYGDCIVLSHGDVIKLPDADLRFEIPDDEGTDF